MEGKNTTVAIAISRLSRRWRGKGKRRGRGQTYDTTKLSSSSVSRSLNAWRMLLGR